MARSLPVLVLFLLSCGASKAPCNASNCAGCCDASGQCQSGISINACGSTGSACIACSTLQQCQLGACVGGIGDGSGGSGGSIEGNGGGAQGGGTNATGGGADTGCNQDNCPFGCCTGSTCNAGQDNNACGSGGHACTTCGSGLLCMSQACQPQPVCDSTTCPTGCCSGGQCVAGQDNNACGGGGHACGTCGSGTACMNHACQPTATCSPQTCSSGCCTFDGQCVLGTSDNACGSGGATCDTCGSGESCSNRVCQQSCNATTCPNGCCSNGQCLSGTSSGACGTGGNTCQGCVNGASCSNHACVGGSGCNASNCPSGCCSGGQCVSGTTGNACGAGGSACSVCGGNQLCLFNQCLDVTPGCGPQSCNGCCSQGVCLAGTDTSACGSGGDACQGCLLFCFAGQCIGGIGGNNGGDAGSGDPCTSDTDCASSFINVGSCVTDTKADGGPSGWVGGYCNPTCQFSGNTCPGNGLCMGDSYCYSQCSAPGTGRSTCRSGYVCRYQSYDDGGVVSGAPGFCVPNCHNAGAGCTSGTCNSLGYCK